MGFTPAEVNLTETIANQLLRYEMAISTQVGNLKNINSNSEQHKAIETRLQEPSFIAKPGQQWQPAQEKVEEYLDKCDDTCGMVPSTVDE